MIKIKCYAKINLSLNILGRRNDNYHYIDTVMLRLKTYYDVLTAEKRTDNKVNITFFGDDEAKNIPYDNTVKKAVDLLKSQCGDFGGVDIAVQKNLGVGGGLGASASNAVAAVDAVNKLFGLFNDDKLRLDLCARLGSDAMFFAMAKGTDYCARVRGVGEIVDTISNNLKMNILIEKGSGLSSKDAFNTFDSLYPNFIYAPSNNDKLIECLNNGDKKAFDYMHNALEKPSMVLDNEITSRKQALIRKGAKKVLVAGSGGSVWGLI